MKLLIFLMSLAALMHHSYGANILVVFPHIYYSHFKATSTLVTKLSSNGHEVTFVSPYPGEVERYEHITEVSIEDIIEPMKEIKNDYLKNQNCWNCYLPKLKYAEQVGYQYSKQILENENFKKLLNSNSSFDLVIIEDVSADALTILSHVFKCPLVVLLSEPVSVFYDNYITDNIFWKRGNELRNAHYWAIKELYRDWFIIPSQNRLVKELIPEAPDLRKLLYQTDLVLMPSYSTLGNLVPKYPNVKQVGGFHIGATRKLSPKMEKVFNESKHGVIIISNNVRSVVDGQLKTLFIKEMVVQDIFFTSDVYDAIGHPKVKLFIGDGDVYDIALAAYNKVPILSLSNNLWHEQFLTNILVEKEIASEIPAEYVDSPEFDRLVHDLLMHNPRYENIRKQTSEILRSNVAPPMDTAIFWIEYVLKFNGATNFGVCPEQLQLSIQNHLLIIIIVLMVLDIALFLFFYWLIKHFSRVVKTMYKRLSSRKRNKSTISYIKL